MTLLVQDNAQDFSVVSNDLVKCRARDLPSRFTSLEHYNGSVGDRRQHGRIGARPDGRSVDDDQAKPLAQTRAQA